jgi:hypothetical protein
MFLTCGSALIRRSSVDRAFDGNRAAIRCRMSSAIGDAVLWCSSKKYRRAWNRRRFSIQDGLFTNISLLTDVNIRFKRLHFRMEPLSCDFTSDLEP